MARYSLPRKVKRSHAVDQSRKLINKAVRNLRVKKTGVGPFAKDLHPRNVRMENSQRSLAMASQIELIEKKTTITFDELRILCGWPVKSEPVEIVEPVEDFEEDTGMIDVSPEESTLEEASQFEIEACSLLSNQQMDSKGQNQDEPPQRGSLIKNLLRHYCTIS